MCAKLNALRRERCVQLASPKQQPHFEGENWTITPISRLCCSRFWECFRLLPLTTTNESKWKNTVKYLSKCPEKPDSADTSRHIDASTRVTDPGNRDVSPDRQAAKSALHTPKKVWLDYQLWLVQLHVKQVLALPRETATVKSLQLGSLPGFELMWKVCLWILWRSRTRIAFHAS